MGCGHRSSTSLRPYQPAQLAHLPEASAPRDTEAVTIKRGGKTYDSRARMKWAQRAMAESSVKQPDVPRPPGPPGLELALSIMLQGQSAPLVFQRFLREYSGLAHFRRGSEHVYLTSDPDLVVEVFQNQGRHTIKPPVLQSSRAVLGEGLLTAEGDHHLRQRRLLQPAFHRDRIAGYARTMVAETEAHVAEWQNGQQIDVAADMSRLTLQIVGQTLFGVDMSGSAQDVAEALDVVLANSTAIIQPLSNIRARLGMPPFGATIAAGNELDKILQRIIEEHRQTGDTGDLLSMMMAAREDGVGMDDAQLRDEAMTLILAGHETTAMWLTWTWLLLAQNQQQSTWLREELDQLPDRPPEFHDLPSLPRTRAVLAESLRLYPPAWMIGRRLMTDVSYQGWTIPTGSVLLAPMWVMHRSPDYWDYPLAFRPQRWLNTEGQYDERGTVRHRGAWYPFGWGNRRCIGDQFAWTEATLLMAFMARNWSMRVTDPSRPVEPEGNITLRPRGGLQMTLEQRTTSLLNTPSSQQAELFTP